MLIILISLMLIVSGCSDTTWEHEAGLDTTRFKEDAKECKAHARTITRQKFEDRKVTSTAPHAGVLEVFITYGVFEEVFTECMREKGWHLKEAKRD